MNGKIDGFSFYKWKGKNVYRRIGKPTKPASTAQLECRKKFATLQNISKIFKPIIRETYNTGKKPLTPANLFIKKNGGVFENITPEGLFDTKFISNCSWFDSAHHANSSNNDKLEYYLRPMKQPHSELEGNSLPERSRRETNTKELNSPDYSKLKLTRSNYPIPFRITLIKHSEELFTIKWEDFTKRYDTISLIVFSPENEKYHKVEMPINENFWHIEIPEEFQTTTNYYYLYCYHSKRKTFSESINLTPEDGADILWKIHKLKRAVTAVTKDINHWSEDNAIEERDMLRFSLMFPLGYLRASFDMGNYQKIPPTNGFLYKREESEIKKRN